jgi:hypothetical protein
MAARILLDDLDAAVEQQQHEIAVVALANDLGAQRSAVAAHVARQDPPVRRVEILEQLDHLDDLPDATDKGQGIAKYLDVRDLWSIRSWPSL